MTIKSLESPWNCIVESKPCVLTIGNFDGIHVGHQSLIEQCRLASPDLVRVALTFDPHPVEVIKGVHLDRIYHPRDQERRMETFGIDLLLRVQFTHELAQWTAEQFFTRFFKEICNVRALVIGPDFALGKNREGDLDKLIGLGRKYGISVTAVPYVLQNGHRPSSSEIRRLLKSGDRPGHLRLANQLLGEAYVKRGLVVHGEGRGQKLGVPTANIDCDIPPLLPRGVYATRSQIKGKSFSAVTNLGVNPTFGGGALRMETHIFGLSEAIYGEELEIAFVDFIREEKKFSSVEALVDQIRRDISQARICLK